MKRVASGMAMGLLAGTALLASSRSAGAQQWEIEIHGGGLLSSSPSGGRSQMPPAGSEFATLGGGSKSRHVSSWYFGDGSALFNEAVSPSPSAATIIPLDSVLAANALSLGGAGIGARVGRRLNRRLTVELSVDYSLARTELRDAARTGIESSRSSFLSAWNQYLGAAGKGVGSVVTSSGGRRRLLAGAAVNVDLTPGRKLVPYVTLGGGIATERGDDLSVELAGEYHLAYTYSTSGSGTTTVSLHESDTVRLRLAGGSSPFALLGVGFKCPITSRLGIRLDVREHLGGNGATTWLAASPSVSSQQPYGALARRYVGSAVALQFSNHASTASSLSGSAISGFETFKGTGTQSQVTVTLGVFLRF